MSVCIENECSTRSLFPFHTREYIASFFTVIAGALAAGICTFEKLVNASLGGGLGGGGLLVPIYVVILGASSRDAIPLSKATIVGNAVASSYLNYRKKHPRIPARPLVDYETMVMMEPMTLACLFIMAIAGTIVGVHLNTVLPEWLTTILLVLLLGNATYRSVSKAKEVWISEATKNNQSGKTMSKLKTFVFHWHTNSNVQPMGDKDVVRLIDASEEIYPPQLDSTENSVNNNVLSVIQKTKETLPKADLGMLVLTWAGLFVFSFLKGGEGAESSVGIVCGSTSFWMVLFASVSFFILVTWFFATRLVERHDLLRQHGYVYPKGDVAWTKKSAIEFPVLCSIAGVAAGCLGIGGGMVKGPILLEMGLLPQVASATSATMILFTASATTIQFIFLGVLPLSYALYYGLLGLLSGLLGETLLAYVVKKYNKTSLVIIVIAITIGLSTITMGILGLSHVITEGFGSFQPLCVP
ncbi:hypothetical protein THRCLA_08647 [Thraustotheca clavata]|uniref:Sulfite exporter TauE/SafE n=1 Tax=Thraustotheca clavata TaxID=74557 RepID=A0A1V9Z3U3_9STRA|nr:hypothetical protein THRCLA_08647 [Thraustotheca clavata]